MQLRNRKNNAAVSKEQNRSNNNVSELSFSDMDNSWNRKEPTYPNQQLNNSDHFANFARKERPSKFGEAHESVVKETKSVRTNPMKKQDLGYDLNNVTKISSAFRRSDSIVIEKSIGEVKKQLMEAKNRKVPSSRRYRIFVKTYAFDSGLVCAVTLGLAFIILTFFLTGFLRGKSIQVTEFSLDYGKVWA